MSPSNTEYALQASQQISENVQESQYISITVKNNSICTRLHFYG